jgi:hypothetical protein
MSFFLPADRALGVPGKNEVVLQWHASADPWFLEAGGRGPPLALRLQENRWRITFGWDADLRSTPGTKAKSLLWDEPAGLGQWTDWVFSVVWSHDDTGRTDIWRNGERVVKYRGPNAYNDLRGVYLKLGSYHPRADQVVYVDDFRVGTSCSSIFGQSDERSAVCRESD